MALLPILDGSIAQKDAGLLPCLSVRGEIEDEFETGITGNAEIAVPLVKILVDISALSGVGLHAAHSRSTG